MNEVFLFMGEYEVIIYLLLLLASLFVFRWLWHAWREWRQAYFSLEREITMRRLGRYAVGAALIIVLACAQTVVGSFIVPGLPAATMIGTPTLDLLGGGGAPDSGTVLAFTPASVAPAVGSEGCVKGQVEIAFPKHGDTVSGPVEIRGTVDVPNFGFYKYEFAVAGSELWATISADRKVVTNDVLGTWFTGTLTPGEYQLRLVVTDTQGLSLPACVISVRVMGQ